MFKFTIIKLTFLLIAKLYYQKILGLKIMQANSFGFNPIFSVHLNVLMTAGGLSYQADLVYHLCLP